MPPSGVVGMRSHRGGGGFTEGRVGPSGVPARRLQGHRAPHAQSCSHRGCEWGDREGTDWGGTLRGAQLLTWGIAGRCGAADVGQQVFDVGHGLSLLLIHRGLRRDGGTRGQGVGMALWV